MADTYLNWDILLHTWLHDPFDKPADIRGHESRAERYASLALGAPVSISELKTRYSDPAASAADRLPMPPIEGDFEKLAVSPSESGTLDVVHPYSGTWRSIQVGLDQEAVDRVILELSPQHGGRKTDFLSLWRFAPERLAEETGLDFESFPAETRNPDHSIWQHLDMTAALALATHSTASRAMLLSFKLAPVQSFIEASRSIRDLLTGSWLLSFLSFAAMKPVLEECGPTAFVFPSLRGLPLMDWWLQRQKVPNIRLDPKDLARPSIPHRFLAIVPSVAAAALAERCIESARSRWREIAARVRTQLNNQLASGFPGWDRLWDAQIESFFDFRTSLVDYAVPEKLQRMYLGEMSLAAAGQIAGLGFTGDFLPGHWQRITKISTSLMESTAGIRHIPAYTPPDEDVPQKCTLLGSYEQMGPAKLSESTMFWTSFHKHNSAGEDADAPDEEATSNRPFNDRLCAVALVKRLATLKYAAPELGIPASEFRIPDTRQFAKRAGKDFRYFAILAFDGDQMGLWLSGEKGLSIGQALHPKIAEHHRANGKESILGMRRPVSPALHAAFSARLTRFATQIVPRIVEEHEGTLIYSGGDDVLAALPLTSVLSCAAGIRAAFSSEEALGSQATGSAGVAIAHYKEDLRFALQAARNAEKAAKDEGRDRMAIAALRRSGGHVTSVCRWTYNQTLQRQYQLFDPCGSERVTDRWTYTLRQQMPLLPQGAFEAEMRRILRHSEGAKEYAGEFVLQYQDSGLKPEVFVDLAQTVSFMTRGRDN